jgi:uroporphyrinogen-III synthase
MAAPGRGELPLAERRVLVTRATHQAGKLSEGLRALGAEPVEVPMLEIRAPENLALLDAALQKLNEYDWLILTSANTVRALAVRATELGIDLTHHAQTRVAVIGKATAETARSVGFRVDLVPETFVAERLAEMLAGAARGKRFLLARASDAREVIPNALRQAGGTVDIIDAYRNVLPEEAHALLRSALKKRIDAATFSSSSGVTHLAIAAKNAGIAFPLAGVAAVSIGPVTSMTLREMGWEPAAEANPSDVSGLIDAVVRVLSLRKSDKRRLPPL